MSDSTTQHKTIRHRKRQPFNEDFERNNILTSRSLGTNDTTNSYFCPNENNVNKCNKLIMRLSFPTVSFSKLSIFVLALCTLSKGKLNLVSQRNIFPWSSDRSTNVVSDKQKNVPSHPLNEDIDSCQSDDLKTTGNWIQLLQSRLFGAPSKTAPFMTENVNSIDLNSPSVPPVQRNHIMSISTASPFVPVADIADLTLDEVGQIIRFSLISGIRDFDRNLFLQGVRPQMRKVLDLFDKAVTQSRAIENGECKVRSMSDVSIGQIDALKFTAATRILAEWRILRQVPDGYKRYAFGMNLGYKDVVQNLVKIERTVHSWIDHQARGDNPTACGPTLRQLLEFEILSGTHPNLPRLRERSGAMGVLWVYRQLQYSARVFSNLLQVPKKFPNTADGVNAAYRQVYERYHGWAVRQIFSYTIQAGPKSNDIYKQMNPHKLKDLRTSSCRLQNNEKNHLEKNPFETFLENLKTMRNNCASNLIKGVDQLVTNVVKIANKEHTSKFEITKGITNSTQELGCNEETIMEGLVDTTHKQFVKFLDDVTPMLGSLSTVLKDMNMDDPNRV